MGSRDINNNMKREYYAPYTLANKILLQILFAFLMGNGISNGNYWIKPTIVVLHGAMWTYTATKLHAYSVAKEAMTATMNYSSGSDSYGGL